MMGNEFTVFVGKAKNGWSATLDGEDDYVTVDAATMRGLLRAEFEKFLSEAAPDETAPTGDT